MKINDTSWEQLSTKKGLKLLRDNGTHGGGRRWMEVEEDVRGKCNEGRKSFGNDGSGSMSEM